MGELSGKQDKSITCGHEQRSGFGSFTHCWNGLHEILILTGLNITPSGNYTRALFLKVQSADPGGFPHSLFLLVIRCHLLFPHCWRLHTTHWWDRGCNWVKLMNSGTWQQTVQTAAFLATRLPQPEQQKAGQEFSFVKLWAYMLYKILHDDMTSMAQRHGISSPEEKCSWMVWSWTSCSSLE